MIGTAERNAEYKAPPMTPDLARRLLTECDRNHSLIYPLIKEEIASYRYRDDELPFPYEFMFFEDDYLQYYLDIIDRKIPCRTIIDIGCEMGFQSYIFEEFDYIGIDCCRMKWFRNKGNYIHDYFWNLDIDLSDKIVISNMSLGYFNEWGEGITNENLSDRLKSCKWLYIGTTPELLNLLKPNFHIIKYFENGGFPRAFLGK